MCALGHRLATLLLIAAISACRSAPVSSGPPIVRPGAPGSSSRVVSAANTAPPKFTAADVRFMQGMIHHHAQAVDMTALLRTRSASDEMKLLALRIDVSQTDEIKMMQRWLEARGQQAPMVMPGMGAMPGMAAMPGMDSAATMMPGMLTPEQMAQLAAAKGLEFDRLFLRFMIQHHAGALVMVKELFSHGGAAQEGEVFTFASDVEADQSAEIARMTKMLNLLNGVPR